MPVFWPKRPVHYALVEIIDKELGRLEKLGVIEKNWLQPMCSSNCICKEKKIMKFESLPIIQPGLNDCLKEINYHLPTMEEISANLNGRRIFSKLDLPEAYCGRKVCRIINYKHT